MRLQFEQALAALPAEVGDAVPQLVAAARVIATAAALGHRERDRRLQLLLRGERGQATALRAVAEALHLEVPSAVNAVLALLPPTERVLPGPAAAALAGPLSPSSAVNSSSSSAARTPPAATEPTAIADEGLQPTVILLGSEVDHAANAGLLRDQGFQIQRYSADIDLRSVVVAGVCGVLVGRTWWQHLPQDRHASFFDSVVQESTFLFVRMATTDLARPLQERLVERYFDLIGRPPDGSLFCHDHACELTATDIQALRRCESLLACAELARFHPRGLSEGEAALLRVLANPAARGRGRDASVRISHLAAGLLHGGRSSARVVVIEPEGTVPLILKLNTTGTLIAELERYRKWIEPWDNGEVRAELQCHGGVAALMYRIVGDADSPTTPAPTLEERIRKLFQQEIWRQTSEDRDALDRDEQDLGRTLELAVSNLERLNRVQPESPAKTDFWRDWSMQSLWRQGVQYQLHGADGSTIDIASLLEAATARVQGLNGRGVVHGDVQLRNILVRDRQPVFIDFEFSGPGHPSLDLASLDTAVTLGAFRMLESEDQLVTLFSDLLVKGDDQNRLRRDHPWAFSCAGSRLAIETSIRTRRAALSVAIASGGGVQDYLAMRLILSCFGLAQLSPQSGVLRACIRALAPAI
jgi:hypothetical protein